jgi:hypothetical protein
MSLTKVKSQVLGILNPALGVTSGGTGLASLTSNSVVLGNGTNAVQLIAPGASGNVLTSDGTTWQSAPTGGLGIGQTLQNLTGSRAFGTTYTNNTGKPIHVIVACTSASGGSQTISASINGGSPVLIAYSVPNTGGFPSITGSVIVPSGATYNITRSSGSLAFWTELR